MTNISLIKAIRSAPTEVAALKILEADQPHVTVPASTHTVAELFTLMAPYIRACVAFNFTPRDGIGAAEAEVTAAMEPLKTALTALVEERDRLRFELDGVNAMREVAAHQANAMPAISEGWRVVPIEPTPEMINAMERAWQDSPENEECEYEYRAMLSAAPTPPAGQQDRGEEPLDTAELVSDERLMWQWNRKDDCLHGRTAVIWFARAVIDDYRAASEATAAQQDDGWKPIEKAPTNEDVLIAFANRDVIPAKLCGPQPTDDYEPDEYRWFTEFGEDVSDRPPIWWRNFPAAPANGEGAG